MNSSAFKLITEWQILHPNSSVGSEVLSSDFLHTSAAQVQTQHWQERMVGYFPGLWWFPSPYIAENCWLFPPQNSPVISSRGRTYVVITYMYVSKKNNLRPGDTIRYIWGLKGLIFILYSAAALHYFLIPILNVIVL